MFEDILLAVIQAGTEFLPISSSGHLVFISKLISQPNLFFFTVLHAASLFAVMIFTRDELRHLLKFDREYRRWWIYLTIATIPAAATGFFFKDFIGKAFSSYLFIGWAFIFTGCVLYSTRFHKTHDSKVNAKNAIMIGLLQALGLFPGASRSGITISTALHLGVPKEKAMKFSFILFIPLALGAVALNCFTENGIIATGGYYFSASLIVSFLVCLVMSLVFLNLVVHIVKKGKFWLFSVYCFGIGLTSLFLHFL
jgi:undecaprenyl-diphosphatase